VRNRAHRLLGSFAIALALATVAACQKDPAAAVKDHVERGDAYVANKQLREAIVEYRSALQIDPRLGDVRFKLARTYSANKDAQNAFGEYVRAADLLPQSVEAQLKAAEILLWAGR